MHNNLTKKSIKKVLTSLILAVVLVMGASYSNVGPFKAIPAQAYEYTQHPYPGYLLGDWMVGWYDVNVQDLQWKLNHWEGYELTRCDIDGYFGPQTRQAVINFQNFAGLTPDGVVGPATWDTLIYNKAM